MLSLTASSLAVLSLSPLFVAANFQIGGGVQIAGNTVVKGHPSNWQPTVSEYLGIPFAQPPVGDLRFKAPKAWKGNSTTTVIADKYSPDCPANNNAVNASALNQPRGVVLAALGQFGDSYDEDCLTLNVWTKPQSGEKAKAVLVWIYGGGFALGSTASPSYNGARLAAEKDVVVVSMNYRLNILGFPGAPGLSDQNLGLLDQRLAVEWVRDNIASFGGDPKRITLFGESAGGASVDMYSYAWVKDPIVNAFIPESGTASLSSSPVSNQSAKWFKASQAVGCGGAEAGEKTLDCMRSKPWKQLLNAIKPEGAAAKLGGMGEFGPMADGKVVFSDYSARAAAGNFIKRPMLVGNNANEIALFASILGQTNLTSPLLKVANGAFGCPSGTAAKARSDKGVKAWRYLYAGDWPNQFLAPGAGAWHGSEISMAFGTTEYTQQFFGEMTGQKISYPDTTAQKKLMDTMMTAWSGFAKDPDMALEKMGWPVYDDQKPSVIKLGDQNSASIDFLSPSDVDRSCGMLRALMSSAPSGGGLGGLLGMLSPGKGNGALPKLPGLGNAGEGALAKGPISPLPAGAGPMRRAPPLPRRVRKY